MALLGFLTYAILDRRILNTGITFVNQVCKGTGAGYIYINPPDTNNDYYLIGATNADWSDCPVSIVAVSRQILLI